MSLSMYQASILAFVKMLNNLSAILDKAEAHAGSRKIDPEGSAGPHVSEAVIQGRQAAEYHQTRRSSPQFEDALQSYFKGRDILAINTKAHAAFQMLFDICTLRRDAGVTDANEPFTTPELLRRRSSGVM